MFRVGQKVVCVNDHGWNEFDRCCWNYPVRGRVYTVDGFEDYYDSPCLTLAEVKQKTVEQGQGFRASRFRPIVERKTDISALTALLNPAHKVLESAQ